MPGVTITERAQQPVDIRSEEFSDLGGRTKLVVVNLERTRLALISVCIVAAGLLVWLLWIQIADPIESAELRAFDKTYAVDRVLAEKMHRLFTPANKIDSQTKWISWGDLTFKRRRGESTRLSLFLAKQGCLGVFEVDGQFYMCKDLDQLNEIVNLAGMKVDARLVPVDQ